MENGKVIDGNCWVAHFDILGFSNMVESFPVEFVREKCKEAKKKGEEYNVNCKFKFFSDSFIFYTDDDSLDSFGCIEATSAMFFRAMFLGKIPMRGCLNVGQFYADEENGIFFGPAHIEAYRLAEGQKWIGFVLSEKARKKLADYESSGFKSNNRLRCLEYEVPYNKEPQRRKLLAYSLKLVPSNLRLQDCLWMALGNMKYKALLMLTKEKGNKNVDIEKCPEYEKIITKYKNTEEFLLCVYPELKERAKNIVQAEI